MVSILDNKTIAELVVKNGDDYQKINPETLATIVEDVTGTTTETEKTVQEHIDNKSIHLTAKDVEDLTKDNLKSEDIVAGANITVTTDPDTNKVTIYTNYAQRIVESFTATENQTTFVASHEIYDKSVLSVNVGNTELTAAAYSLGADKKTVTLVNGLSAGTLVDLKYFYNLNIGTGGLDNPTPVNITSGSGINPKGDWDSSKAYIASDFVTYEDSTAQYGYLGLQDNIPAGTELTNTTYWMEMYKILKTYIAATIVDWGE